MNISFVNLLSLQTQCQLLSPLTHIASILSNKRSLSISKNINKSCRTSLSSRPLSHENNELENPESFTSALNSVEEIFCDKSSRKWILEELLNCRSNDENCLRKKFVKLYVKKFLIEKRRPLQWVVSHSSYWSFNDNKYYLNENINNKLFSKYIDSFRRHNYCSVRTFKTKPQPFLGLGNTRSSLKNASTSEAKLGSIFGFKKDKTISGLENEKIKALMNDENMNNEEKERIKIAFAEGYLAAEPKMRASSKLRLFNIFRDLMGIVLILAILFSFTGELSGGSFRRVLIGGTSEVHPEEIDVTFDDVKGVDEAKQELQEIVEFLRNPDKFSVLGGKLPKGVLLVGPPGTGKTLLARAVAGEAGVPFFHAAGPEFDEILVGQGARRVRDLFSTAKLKAPCVVFIDEIDSVGAKRTNSVLHPYANQTINQLLTEMDGFRQNEGVIVLGATNRRDDLDRALLRPGRFDVEVQVPIPDFVGRKEILELYLGKVKYADDVNIDLLSRGTTGFTGADIENMVNQAALRAAIDGSASVTMKYLENSRDKVLMGPERKSRIPDEEANIITAYHEGGHALVAHYTKDSNPLHKVTIVPRGPSLGHTAYIPEKERYHVTKSQMLATMDTLMGGRAAEELIFGLEKITTGASSDLKQATSLATHMVKEWGMSEKIGVRTFDEDHNSLIIVNELAPTTSENIDNEIKKILQDSYERAKAILKTHSREHRLIAEALLKYETLNAEEVKSILAK